jgi:hypothetical protein
MRPTYVVMRGGGHAGCTDWVAVARFSQWLMNPSWARRNGEDMKIQEELTKEGMCAAL